MLLINYHGCMDGIDSGGGGLAHIQPHVDLTGVGRKVNQPTLSLADD